MDGVVFNPSRRVFRWLEDIHKEELRLRADLGLNGQVVRGRLTVFLSAFILADVDLVIRINESAAQPPTSTIPTLAAAQGPSRSLPVVLGPTHGCPYRRIFPPTVTATRRSSSRPNGWALAWGRLLPPSHDASFGRRVERAAARAHRRGRRVPTLLVVKLDAVRVCAPGVGARHHAGEAELYPADVLERADASIWRSVVAAERLEPIAFSLAGAATAAQPRVSGHARSVLVSVCILIVLRWSR
jgi:hypothetical protein